MDPDPRLRPKPFLAAIHALSMNEGLAPLDLLRPLSSPERTLKVYLCRGSDCRENKLSRKVLETYAAGHKVVKVGCQKVCKAPVVGIDTSRGPRWFRRMNRPELLSALKSFVETGKLPKSLAAYEATKRAGRLR